MTAPVVARIGALVIDPVWHMGVVEFDGARHAFIAFEHPTLGLLHFHLSHETIGQSLPAALASVKEGLR